MTEEKYDPQANQQNRRKQVIDAACECFRRKGFRSTSIKDISLRSGMSPGHIYFNDKESIISTIIEREWAVLADIINFPDVADRCENALKILTDMTEELLKKCQNPLWSSLIIEIGAEAARNANILKMVQKADAFIFNKMFNSLKEMNAFPTLSDEELNLCLHLIATIFNGFVLRIHANGEYNIRAMADLCNNVIRSILCPRIPV